MIKIQKIFYVFRFAFDALFIVLYQSMASEKEQTVEEKRLHILLLGQMLTLATSGFGLVAALAWNNVIQEFVNQYVKKWFPASGIMSLLLYAVIVTALAVFVTYQLSLLIKRLGAEIEKK